MKRFLTLVLLASSLTVAGCRTPAGIETDGDEIQCLSDPLDARIQIVAEAGTFEELVQHVKPTLVLRRHMLWVTRDEKGQPLVKIAEPLVYEKADGGKPLVLIHWKGQRKDPQADGYDSLAEELDRVDYEVVCSFARKVTKPDYDSGPENHIVELSRHKDFGTLYRVFWDNGPHSKSELRQYKTLFLLEDASGRWRIIAEGLDDEDGRMGNVWRWQATDYHDSWTDDPAAPVRIEATCAHGESDCMQHSGSDYDLSLYRDGLLCGPPEYGIRWTSQEYVIAEKGDNLELIARRLACFESNATPPSWWDTDVISAEMLAEEKAKWDAAVRDWKCKLENANKDFRRVAIPKGTHIVVPEAKER